MAVSSTTSSSGAPNETAIVRLAAVHRRVATYRSHGEKTSIGFTVSGDVAFERHIYVATDTDRQTGIATTDRGQGINIFRRDADGTWRVAIDGWSSALPAR